MLLFAIIVCLSISAVTCQEDQNVNVQLTAVQSESELLSLYPDAIPLQKVVPNVDQIYNIQYVGGSRRAGDALVSTAHNASLFPNPSDVTLNLSYPAQGLGAQVTFLVIAVTQTSNIGKAYITSGGIGQRQISVAVTASHTTVFNYQANFYGIYANVLRV